VGSVFSPRYEALRGDPRRHVALNVALYRLDGGASSWIFAEHDGRASFRDGGALAVGSSLLERSGDGLHLSFDEVTSPFPRPALPRRLRGTIRLRGESRGDEPPIALDDRGEHLWWPLLPQGILEVDVPELGLRWRGKGYHDANAGDAPLTTAFRRWTWGRFHQGEQSLLVYDTEPLVGPSRSVALCLGHGRREALPSFATRTLGRGAWGLPVVAPSDRGAREPVLLHTLEDSPFYGRHVVEATLRDERLRGVTEVLSAERFARGWVRFLLPFRMRFAARATPG
jgi:carotenoid 1,2-hydratase